MRPIRIGLVMLAWAAALSHSPGCGGEKSAPRSDAPAEAREPWADRGLVQITRDQDKTLLGFAYEDSMLGLRFHPPRGWPPLEPELFDQALEIIGRSVPRGDRYQSQPARIFYEKENNFFMIVAFFPNWDVPIDPLSAFEGYRDRIKRVMGEVTVVEDTYAMGDIAVYEILIHNPLMVNLRSMLIRKGRPPVQVDYLVPRPAYPNLVKAIEASIGSFETLH